MSKEDLLIKLDDILLNEIKKGFKNFKERREDCRKNGSHLEPKVEGAEYMPRIRAWMYCKHCGEYYERPLTEEELKEMRKKLTEPMTI